MIRSRLVSSLVVTGLIAVIGSFSSFAQDPAAKKTADKSASTDKTATTAPTDKKKNDPSRRVPAYFGQIGLNPEQKESIYKIRKTHQDKVDALRKQITESEAKSMTECEAVLTDTQKKLLDNLRSGGAKSTGKAADAVKTTTDSAKTKN